MCQTILQRVAAGDATAVDDCLAQYGALVWSLVRRYCSNHADAEDAAQEVFVGIWRGAARFDPAKGSEPAFITMVARRRLIDRHRKLGRQIDTSELDDAPGAANEDPTVRVELSEEATFVRQRMAELRPEERRVLELAISSGLSQSEIAEATSMPLGTVKTHARRGMIRLRELLGAEVSDRRTEARS